MAVFRVEKTKDYTVMSNHHLKNKHLSLKSKGLLSMILSLPEEWNYTTRGLASICKEGVDCIGALLRELENAGYIQRNRLRDERGRITDTEYVIYEFPQEKSEKEPNTDEPYTPLLHTDSPHTENPYMDKSDTENPAQYNTNISNSEKNKILNVVNKNQSITGAGENSPQPTNETVDEIDWINKFNQSRKTVKENISYDSLYEKHKYDRKMLDSIVEIMVDYLCVNRSSVTISGAEYPIEIIRENLLKLDSSHIEYVIGCMNANTTKVYQLDHYLLKSLYNAPVTIDPYYQNRVNYDMANGFGIKNE